MIENIKNTLTTLKSNDLFMKELISFTNNSKIIHKNIFIDNIHSINLKKDKMHKTIKDINETLNNSIYGHDNAKRQIERVIGQWITGKQTGYCFGFEGLSGVGKTSLAKNGLSKCLKDAEGVSRPFFYCIGGFE